MWTVVASLAPDRLRRQSTSSASVHCSSSAAAVAGALITERLTGPRSALRDGSAVITGLLLGLILPAGFPTVDGVRRRCLRHWLRQGHLRRARPERLQPGAGWTRVPAGGVSDRDHHVARLQRWACSRCAATTSRCRCSERERPRCRDCRDTARPHEVRADGHRAVAAAVRQHWRLASVRRPPCCCCCAARYLAYKRYLEWRIPVSIFATVGALSALLWLINGARYPDPLFMLLSGGLMFGAIYMATDMVTSPVTRTGRVDLRRGHWRTRRADPHVGRSAGGRHVRDPAHECARPVHQPHDPATRLRHRTATEPQHERDALQERRRGVRGGLGGAGRATGTAGGLIVPPRGDARHCRSPSPACSSSLVLPVGRTADPGAPGARHCHCRG
jgi:hypothetical protein